MPAAFVVVVVEVLEATIVVVKVLVATGFGANVVDIVVELVDVGATVVVEVPTVVASVVVVRLFCALMQYSSRFPYVG